uniref:Uncharacterized protein n=1 Tax=Cynoglossus semilaevis TaxID=244447 RepID=A0A3P8UZN4_CYNSE
MISPDSSITGKYREVGLLKVFFFSLNTSSINAASLPRQRTMASACYADELTCSICLAIFSDPVMLLCGHSFCRKCIEDSLTSKRLCPQCRADVPTEGACFLTNHILKSLVDAQLCPEHEEKLKLFCITDQQLACIICRDGDKHDGHKFKPIKEAAVLVREELEVLKQQLSIDTTALEYSVKAQAGEITKTKTTSKQLMAQISKQFQEMQEFLRKKEMKIKCDLTQEEEDAVQKMTKALTVLETALKESKEQEEKVEAVLKITDSEKFLKSWTENESKKRPEVQDVEVVKSLRCVSAFSCDEFTSGQHYWEIEVGKRDYWARTQTPTMAGRSYCEHLTCGICLSIFTDPVTLACGHSFCRLCITDERNSKNSCPQCRTPVVVKGALLPTSHILKSLADKVKELCPEHQEELTLFCVTDQQLACMMCRHGERHQKHRFQRIDKADVALREKLENLLQQVSNDVNATERRHTAQREEITKAIQKSEQLTNQIHRQFEEMHVFLREREAQILTELKHREEDAVQKMSMVLSGLEEILTQNAMLMGKLASTLEVREPDKFIKCWTENNSTSPNQIVFQPRANEFQVVNSWLSLGPYESHLQTRPPQMGPRMGINPFYCGQHYWEIDVGHREYWELGIRDNFLKYNEQKYSICSSHTVTELMFEGKPRKIGVYLNCPSKKISFYDADNMTHIDTLSTQGMSFPLPAYFNVRFRTPDPNPMTVCWY